MIGSLFAGGLREVNERSVVFDSVLDAFLLPEAGAVLLLDNPEATLGFFEGGGGANWMDFQGFPNSHKMCEHANI